MPAVAQRLRYVDTTETCLRRAARVNFHQLPTSVFSFVRQFSDECRPSGIHHRLSQPSACQAFDVEFFNGDCAVVGNKPATNLVMEVQALVADMRVRSLKQLDSFSSSLATLLSTSHFTLRLAEATLRAAIVARVLNLLTVRERGESDEPDIYADGFNAWWQGLGFTFDREACNKASRFALNRERLDFTFDNTMQFNFNLADFGKL